MNGGMSYTQKILNLLHEANGEWIPSYHLEKVETKWGWIGPSGARRARELAERDKATGEPLQTFRFEEREYIVEVKDEVYAYYRMIPKRPKAEQAKLFNIPVYGR